MLVGWLVLVLCSVAAGAAVVAVMVARPSLEFPFAAAGVVLMGVSVYVLVRLSIAYGSEDAAVWAFVFIIAAAAGGYALASTLLYRLAVRSDAPRLPESLPDDIGDAAVFVVACTEPETYRPGATATMLQRLADEDLLDASIGFLPFLFFAQKTRYRAVGGRNPAHRELASIAEQLAGTLGSARVRPALCVGPESLESQVVRAISAGHRRVVLAELSVGESAVRAAVRKEVDDLRLPAQGIAVSHTGVLSCSERIIGMLAARTLAAATDPATTGVVLVGHGQPEEIAARNPQMDEDETVFLSRLRMTLLDAGMAEAHVRIAWEDWGDPDVTTTIRHLAALGCTRIVVVPAAFPLDTIATRLDLEISVKQARVEETATVITLPAWKDDPAVVEELRSRIATALERSLP